MKTPEEWDKEFDYSPKWGLSNLNEFVHAIQLDAIRHGMTLAAKIAEGFVGASDGATAIKNAILTARDNLTK